MNVSLTKRRRKPPLKNRALLLEVIRRAMRLTGMAGATEPGSQTAKLNVILVGKDRIRQLNHQFLGRNEPTDVLAFDLRPASVQGGGDWTAAEIYVCLDVAVEAAEQYTTSTASETVLYIVHGMLHIAGEDDRDSAGRQRMRRRQRNILARLCNEFELEEIFVTT